jgi:hypothetical protein
MVALRDLEQVISAQNRLWQFRNKETGSIEIGPSLYGVSAKAQTIIASCLAEADIKTKARTAVIKGDALTPSLDVFCAFSGFARSFSAALIYWRKTNLSISN